MGVGGRGGAANKSQIPHKSHYDCLVSTETNPGLPGLLSIFSIVPRWVYKLYCSPVHCLLFFNRMIHSDRMIHVIELSIFEKHCNPNLLGLFSYHTSNFLFLLHWLKRIQNRLQEFSIFFQEDMVIFFCLSDAQKWLNIFGVRPQACQISEGWETKRKVH